MNNNKPTEGESYGGEFTRDTPAQLYAVLRAMEKHINNMTPKERLEYDKVVEEMEGEICALHGDGCECSEDTKRKMWARESEGG